MERRRSKRRVSVLELGKMAIRGNRTVQEHRRRTLSITGLGASFLKAFSYSPNSSRFDSSSTRDHQDERREHSSLLFLLTRRQGGWMVGGRQGTNPQVTTATLFFWLSSLVFRLFLPIPIPPALISMRDADVDSATEKETRRCHTAPGRLPSSKSVQTRRAWPKCQKPKPQWWAGDSRQQVEREKNEIHQTIRVGQTVGIWRWSSLIASLFFSLPFSPFTCDKIQPDIFFKL